MASRKRLGVSIWLNIDVAPTRTSKRKKIVNVNARKNANVTRIEAAIETDLKIVGAINRERRKIETAVIVVVSKI